MAKNKISDLRDHMFAALERLSDETLKPEEQELEIRKAKEIAAIGNTIINSAKAEIDFIKATGKIDSGSELFKGISTTTLPSGLD